MNYIYKLTIKNDEEQDVYYNSYSTQEEMLGDLHNAEKAIELYENALKIQKETEANKQTLYDCGYTEQEIDEMTTEELRDEVLRLEVKAEEAWEAQKEQE